MSIPMIKPFWLLFWWRPAKAMPQLLDSRRGHLVALVMATLFGSIQCLRLLPKLFETMLWNGVLYGICSLVGVFLFTWLLRNFGLWFGADAQLRDLRTAFGFGVLPWMLLFAALLWVLNSGLQPQAIATNYFPVFFCAFVYGFYILLFSLSAALHLSIIKTLLCLVVTVLLCLFPLTFLAQLLAGCLR